MNVNAGDLLILALAIPVVGLVVAVISIARFK